MFEGSSDYIPNCPYVENFYLNFVICSLDLGISSDLRRNNIVNVKLVLRVQKIEATTSVVINSFSDIAQNPVAQAIHPMIEVTNLNPIIEGIGLLDDLPDTAFALVVSSIADFVLSSSNDGLLSNDETIDPNLVAEGGQWGTPSTTDYEIVQKRGARKNICIDSWTQKAFNK